MTQVANVTKIDSAQSAILAVRRFLNDKFPQREEQVDGVLWAILSGEHVVLLGPVGLVPGPAPVIARYSHFPDRASRRTTRSILAPALNVPLIVRLILERPAFLAR